MTDKPKFLFSHSAAERILGLKPFTITNLEIKNDEQIEVTTKNKHRYYILKKRFVKDFVESRKAKTNKLKVERTHYLNVYGVTNTENLNRYPVRVTNCSIECKCRDYQKQQEILGKGCCKHGFAVLKHLGYSSVKQYLESQATA